MTDDISAAIETEKKALSLLRPDASDRGECEAALAKFEAALKPVGSGGQPDGE